MTSQPLALSLNRHPRKVFHCRDLLLSWIFHRIFTSFPIKFSVDSWSQWSNFFYMCYFLFYWEKKKNKTSEARVLLEIKALFLGQSKHFFFPFRIRWLKKNQTSKQNRANHFGKMYLFVCAAFRMWSCPRNPGDCSYDASELRGLTFRLRTNIPSD